MVENTMVVKGHTFRTFILEDCVRIMNEAEGEILEADDECLNGYYGGSINRFFGHAIGWWLACE